MRELGRDPREVHMGIDLRNARVGIDLRDTPSAGMNLREARRLRSDHHRPRPAARKSLAIIISFMANPSPLILLFGRHCA